MQHLPSIEANYYLASNRIICHWLRLYGWLYLSLVKRSELLKLAETVLRLPTAPYHEHLVCVFVRQYCRALGLSVSIDRVGNLCVRYRDGSRRPPLTFVAHMDHPGFSILDSSRAEFFGGVPPELVQSARIRVHGSDGTTRATVRRIHSSQWPRRKLVDLRADGPVRAGDFGTWDLPAFRVQRGLMRAAAIDDLLAVATMLALLTDLVQRKIPAHVWCLFTRAEEVGFQGAIEAARARLIPRDATVISIEMSRERPWARIGAGPVVRVGDRLTIFDPTTTAFLEAAARRCQASDSTFLFQRCLMDGGACEASAFAGFGYRVGGLCLALGHYHNVGEKGRIRAEYVSVKDWEQLVQLCCTVAADRKARIHDGARLRARIMKIHKLAPRTLKRICIERFEST